MEAALVLAPPPTATTPLSQTPSLGPLGPLEWALLGNGTLLLLLLAILYTIGRLKGMASSSSKDVQGTSWVRQGVDLEYGGGHQPYSALCGMTQMTAPKQSKKDEKSDDNVNFQQVPMWIALPPQPATHSLQIQPHPQYFAATLNIQEQKRKKAKGCKRVQSCRFAPTPMSMPIQMPLPPTIFLPHPQNSTLLRQDRKKLNVDFIPN